jgi:hypothetical protein
MSAPFNSSKALLAATTLLLIVVARVGAQAPSLAIPRERVLALNMLIDPEPIIVVAPATAGTGVAWRQEVRSRFTQGGGFDGVRVHVLLDSSVGEGFSLVVTDAGGTVLDSMRGSAAAPLREFWSVETATGVAFVELRREVDAPAPGARITYAYHVTPTEKQAITCDNQLMPIANAPFRIRQLGKPVARLRFIIPGQGQATCTAFMVGDRLALTNQHCISNDREKDSALVDFNYDNEDSSLTGIRVESIVATNAGLDYTLLKLAAPPPAGTGRLHFVPSTWSWTPSPQPHALVVVQHPSGLPKQASVADCQLAGPDRVRVAPGSTCNNGNLPGLDRVGVTPGDRTDFGHLCDTKGGSSGAPVLDWDTGFVVGLHHFGFLETSSDPVNQAVVHSRILQDIARQDKAAHAEMIRPRP